MKNKQARREIERVTGCEFVFHHSGSGAVLWHLKLSPFNAWIPDEELTEKHNKRVVLTGEQLRRIK